MDAILISLVVDVVVTMVSPVEVMVALKMIHMELVQIVPLPQTLGEDVDISDILNNMISLSRA